MAERTIVVDHLKLSYEGLFNASELYNLIASWFYEKGWDWFEKVNQEQITPSGKQITIILEPWKSVSDYYKLSIRLKIHMYDLKDVEVEHNEDKLRLNHGEVRMMFDGYVVSDRKDKWSAKPLNWFLSIIMEKYFYRSHYRKFETWLLSDVDDLHNKIKNYLNVFKYSYQQ